MLCTHEGRWAEAADKLKQAGHAVWHYREFEGEDSIEFIKAWQMGRQAEAVVMGLPAGPRGAFISGFCAGGLTALYILGQQPGLAAVTQSCPDVDSLIKQMAGRGF
jgi:dienelactone hydrolase